MGYATLIKKCWVIRNIGNIARILPEYCQNIGNIARILPEYCQNIARILPEYCQNIARIFPEYWEYCQNIGNIARILPEYCQNIARMLWILPEYCQNIVNIARVFVECFYCFLYATCQKIVEWLYVTICWLGIADKSLLIFIASAGSPTESFSYNKQYIDETFSWADTLMFVSILPI